MSNADTIREWAIRLRAFLEVNNAFSVTVELQDGTAIEYDLGDGLTWITPEGRTLEVPESALDEEKWTVAT